jgi:hypothetical protein
MEQAIDRSGDRPALAIPRRAALVGLVGGGLAAGLAVVSASRLRGSQQSVIRPEDFARSADGGDAAPMIQAAIDHAAASGGGRIRLTAGKTYPLRAIAPGSDVTSDNFRASLAIPADAANITFDLNGATLQQQSDAFTFGSAYRLFNDQVMRQTLRPLGYTPARGDTSIRVPDPSAYRAGSRIMLVSGNISQQAYTPIAEMFAVVGVKGDTILLDRPVSKDHGLARGDRVGIIDITRNSASNISLLGPGRILNPYRRAGNLMQVFGLTMSRVDFQGAGGFLLRGRNLAVSDCRVTITRAAGSSRPYALAFDTGSNDITVDRFTAIGEPFCYIHLHEGLSNVRLSDIVVRNQWRAFPDEDRPVAAISILGLSWNVALDNVEIVNNSEGPAIESRLANAARGGNSGLAIKNVVVRGNFRGKPVVLDDPDSALVENLDVSQAVFRAGRGRL